MTVKITSSRMGLQRVEAVLSLGRKTILCRGHPWYASAGAAPLTRRLLGLFPSGAYNAANTVGLQAKKASVHM
jgi:hypothetical protein